GVETEIAELVERSANAVEMSARRLFAPRIALPSFAIFRGTKTIDEDPVDRRVLPPPGPAIGGRAARAHHRCLVPRRAVALQCEHDARRRDRERCGEEDVLLFFERAIERSERPRFGVVFVPR